MASRIPIAVRGGHRTPRRFVLMLTLGIFLVLLGGGDAGAAAVTSSTLEERLAPVGQVRFEGQSETSTVDPFVAFADAPAPVLVPAPQPKRGDYPSIGVSSRSVVWVVGQMHLFFAAFVLAVPLFVLVIEWLGVKTGDARYDDMAHEFM